MAQMLLIRSVCSEMQWMHGHVAQTFIFRADTVIVSSGILQHTKWVQLIDRRLASVRIPTGERRKIEITREQPLHILLRYM